MVAAVLVAMMLLFAAGSGQSLMERWLPFLAVDSAFRPTHAIVSVLLVAVLAVVTMLEQRTRRVDAAARMLHGVLEAIPSCSVLIVDHDGNIASANEHTSKMFGYDRHELLGQALTLLLPRLKLSESASRDINQESDAVAEHVGKRKDGQEIMVELGASAPDDHGATTLILRDITKAKNTQQALREREAHLRLMVEQMPAILWTTDANLKVTSTMGAGLAAIELNPQEIVGTPMLEDSGPRQPGSAPETVHMQALLGQSVSYETDWRRHALQVRVEPLRNAKKRITGTIGIVLDITDRKHTLAELKERVRQQAAVAELGQQALVTHELQELFQKASALIAKTLQADFSLVAMPHHEGPALYLSAGVGWLPRYPVGVRVVDDMDSLSAYNVTTNSVLQLETDAEGRLRTPAFLQQHGVAGGLCTGILGQQRAHGALGVFTRQRRQFTQDDAHFLRAIANILATRIEHARAEQARSRLAAILEATTDLVAIMDKDQRLLYLNRAGRSLLGLSASEDVRGKPIADFLAETVRQQFAVLAAPVALRQGVWQGEIVWRTREGREVPASQVVLAHKAPDGDVEFFSTIARDLGERRKLEEQLRQALKLEAVGRLAGGIAHDFNNLLCIINGYCDLLLNAVQADETARDFTQQIKQAGDRAASLTQQLLAFSRKQMLKPTTLNINTLLLSMQRMLGRLIGEDIEFTAALEPSLRPIQADPGQIEQILLNLAVNARDAMPEGGKLAIASANVQLDALPEHPEVVPGPYVALMVTDTGCGMPAEVLEHIFEPFFTTKEFGKGTGLGLAMVYGIVKQSGGHIEVDSAVGHGTTFKIYLPALEKAVVAEAEPAAIDAAPRGTETILLVEDEKGVRAMARRVLEQSGYTVLEAADGASALTQVETHPGPIHLLLTDVIMPRISGGRVAQLLMPQRPNMKVLYMSGYADSALVRNGIVSGEVDCILKPFSPDALANIVRDVLDRKPAPAAMQDKLARRTSVALAAKSGLVPALGDLAVNARPAPRRSGAGLDGVPAPV